MLLAVLVAAVLAAFALAIHLQVSSARHRQVQRYQRETRDLARLVTAVAEGQVRAFWENASRTGQGASCSAETPRDLSPWLRIDPPRLVARGSVDPEPRPVELRTEGGRLELKLRALTADASSVGGLLRVSGTCDLGRLVDEQRKVLTGLDAAVVVHGGVVVRAVGELTLPSRGFQDVFGEWGRLVRQPLADEASDGEPEKWGVRQLWHRPWEPSRALLGGQEFLVFPQEALIRPPQRTDEDSLATTTQDPAFELQVVGLVRSSRVDRESRTLAPMLAVPLALFGLACLLAWPLLRLFLLEPGETVGRLGLVALVVGAVGIAAVGCCGLLLLTTEQTTVAGVDRQLEEFAEDLRKAFVDERKKVKDLIEKVKQEEAKLEHPAMRPALRDDVTRLLGTGFPGRDEYPFLLRLSCVDERGSIRSIWTIDDCLPAKVNVSDRGYFRRAKENEAVAFVEPVLSYATGERGTIVAMTGGGPCAVVSVFTRLLSLERVITAGGFVFAVLDRDGSLLYHSEPGCTVARCFLEDCDDAERLHQYLGTGAQRSFNVGYRGGSYRAFVSPLLEENNNGDPCGEWTLVVMRDLGPIRSAALHGMSVTWAAAAVIGGGLVLLFWAWKAPVDQLGELLKKGAWSEAVAGAVALVVAVVATVPVFLWARGVELDLVEQDSKAVAERAQQQARADLEHLHARVDPGQQVLELLRKGGVPAVVPRPEPQGAEKAPTRWFYRALRVPLDEWGERTEPYLFAKDGTPSRDDSLECRWPRSPWWYLTLGAAVAAAVAWWALWRAVARRQKEQGRERRPAALARSTRRLVPVLGVVVLALLLVTQPGIFKWLVSVAAVLGTALAAMDRLASWAKKGD